MSSEASQKKVWLPPDRIMPGSYMEQLRWLDLQDGILHVDDEIDGYAVQRTLMEVSEMMRRKMAKIVVKIFSPGGDVYGAMAIHDAIKKLDGLKSVKVEAVAEGLTASAAASIVLQAARHRIARPHTRFLLHEVSADFHRPQKAADLKAEAQETEKLMDIMVDIMSERAKKSPEEIKEALRGKELYLSAEEALEWGLIDEVAA